MALAALVRLQLVMRAVEASLLADDAVVVRLRDPDGRTVAVAAAQHWRRHGLAARAVTAGLGLGVVAAVTAVLAMLVLAAVVALVAVGVPPSTAGWVGLGGVVAGAVAVLAGVARLGRIDVAGHALCAAWFVIPAAGCGDAGWWLSPQTGRAKDSVRWRWQRWRKDCRATGGGWCGP